MISFIICMLMYTCIQIKRKKLYLCLETYRDTPDMLSKSKGSKLISIL